MGKVILKLILAVALFAALAGSSGAQEVKAFDGIIRMGGSTTLLQSR